VKPLFKQEAYLPKNTKQTDTLNCPKSEKFKLPKNHPDITFLQLSLFALIFYSITFLICFAASQLI